MDLRTRMRVVLAALGLVVLYAGPALANAQPVPEPSSLVLLAVGAGGLAWWLGRRR